MKILFLTQLFPYPLNTGGQIKSYHFLKALSRKYDIVLVSFIRSEKEKEYIEHLMPFCRRIEVCEIKRSFFRNIYYAFKSIFTGRSFIICRDYVPEMNKTVSLVIKEESPDFIHVDHLQMAQYGEGYGKSKIILDEHNVESFIISRIAKTEKNPLKRIFAGLESKSLERFEKNAVIRSDLVLSVSEIDRKTLIGLTGKKEKIRAIPIGVDTEYFYYKSLKNNGSNTVVFIGTLYWPPNIDAVRWFYERVWINIKKNIGDLKWKIVGLNPVEEVLKLSGVDKDIEVYGSVADIRPFMWEEGIFIVPLFSGSGMRVKILNAMACGIPVISTTIGAEGIEGLEKVASHQSPVTSYNPNIWIADSPEEFVKAIIALLKDKNLIEQLSKNGRKLMEEKYSWEIQGSKLLKAYKDILDPDIGSSKREQGEF